MPRVHIFWQRRIRAGDTTTPWWFPSQTSGGSIREDRLVLPIPPGTHWSEAKPIVLPGMVGGEQSAAGREDAEQRALPTPRKRRGHRPTEIGDGQAPQPRGIGAMGKLRFVTTAPAPACPPPTAHRPPKKQKAKNDPRLIAAARELKDRWLEHVNANPAALASAGKYDVGRAIASEATATFAERLEIAGCVAIAERGPIALLPAA